MSVKIKVGDSVMCLAFDGYARVLAIKDETAWLKSEKGILTQPVGELRRFPGEDLLPIFIAGDRVTHQDYPGSAVVLEVGEEYLYVEYEDHVSLFKLDNPKLQRLSEYDTVSTDRTKENNSNES